MNGFGNLISENTISYLTQQFPFVAPGWIRAFDQALEGLAKKWRLSLFGCEKASRFGTILYADSADLGKVAVKIIPAFSPRLQSEIYCYRALPYREMCPLYDVDESLGALLLKYAPETDTYDKTKKSDVFASLFDEKLECTGDNAVLPRYEDVLSSVLQNAVCEIQKRDDKNLLAFIPSIQRAIGGMDTFHGAKRYVIHGDAHEHNMLVSGEECVLIDPLGYIAPFEFEVSRYLGTAMKHSVLDSEDFFRLASRITPYKNDLSRQLTAFCIDTTLRACNTFIEGNTYEEILFGADWAARAWKYLDDYSRL